MTFDTSYSGTDNLLAMKTARRYNAFLGSMINAFAPKDGKILDFGAGAGTFAHIATTPSRSVICVEKDTALRDSLVADGFEVYASLKAIPDNSIAFAYTLNVLEHIEDDKAETLELYRILKPGAVCFAFVPALKILYSAMDAKVGHIRRYNLGELKSLFHQSGFSINDARYADSLGFFASLLYKWIGSADGSINVKMLSLYDRFIFPISRFLDTFTFKIFGKNCFVVARKITGDNANQP